MRNWLDTMRNESSSKRRLVAFGLSLFFTGILFVVWLSVWLPDFFYNQNLAEKNNQFESPKDTILTSIGNAWQVVVGEYSDLRKTTSQKSLYGAVEYTSGTSTQAN